MLKTRVMPCLLLRRGSLVKTVKFDDPIYVGDPLNAVRIYCEKEVDEIVFLDITATSERSGPPMQLLSELASECFMPAAYGGGIQNVDQIREILSLGFEKVILNTAAVDNPTLVSQAAERFGSQSIVVSIDARREKGKYVAYTHAGRRTTGRQACDLAAQMQKLGAGELLLTSVDKEGTMSGYDIELLQSVTRALEIPVIASGGAGNLSHLAPAIREGGASALALGSMAVYFGRLRAVLVNFPTRGDIERELG